MITKHYLSYLHLFGLLSIRAIHSGLKYSVKQDDRDNLDLCCFDRWVPIHSNYCNYPSFLFLNTTHLIRIVCREALHISPDKCRICYCSRSCVSFFHSESGVKGHPMILWTGRGTGVYLKTYTVQVVMHCKNQDLAYLISDWWVLWGAVSVRMALSRHSRRCRVYVDRPHWRGLRGIITI